VFEIDEGPGGPERRAQLVARHYAASTLQQHLKDEERLFLEP